jgi:hypothetical protein
MKVFVWLFHFVVMEEVGAYFPASQRVIWPTINVPRPVP